MPSVIKIAIGRNCPVLSYDYIFRCLEESGKVDQKEFRLNTTKLSNGLTKDVSIGKKHFHKTKTFISILKKSKKGTGHENKVQGS